MQFSYRRNAGAAPTLTHGPAGRVAGRLGPASRGGRSAWVRPGAGPSASKRVRGSSNTYRRGDNASSRGVERGSVDWVRSRDAKTVNGDRPVVKKAASVGASTVSTLGAKAAKEQGKRKASDFDNVQGQVAKPIDTKRIDSGARLEPPSAHDGSKKLTSEGREGVVSASSLPQRDVPNEQVACAGVHDGFGPILRGPKADLQSMKGSGNKVWKRNTPTTNDEDGTNNAEAAARNGLARHLKEQADKPVDLKLSKRGQHSLVLNPLKRKQEKMDAASEKNSDQAKKRLTVKDQRGSNDTAPVQGGRGNPAGRGGRGAGGSVAKRIRLNKNPGSEVVDAKFAAEEGKDQATANVKNQGDDKTTEMDMGAEPSRGKPAAAFTDFAYMETSKTAGRGHQRGRGKGSVVGPEARIAAAARGGRRNMGLVRVRSEDARTPVCRAFARGLPCTDEFCTKRHDVPQECAVPLCSFFQRNGQCLRRETCPFRHVKVDPRAAICSSFNLLGYCEDKSCTMRHIRR